MKYQSFRVLGTGVGAGPKQEAAFLTLNKWLPIKTTHQSFVVIDNPTYPYSGFHPNTPEF